MPKGTCSMCGGQAVHSRCAPCNRAYQREYRKRPGVAAKHVARSTQWNTDNPERHREHKRNWRHRNPERHRATAEALRRGVEVPNNADVLMREVLRLDPCAYCGKPGGGVDHIEPISHGGDNASSNLTGACVDCNRSKFTRSLLEQLRRRPLGAAV